MLKCKNCGCTVTPELKKGKYVYLRPNSKEGCTCKQINETIALEEVEKVLNSMVFPQNTLEQLKATLKNAIKAKSDYSQNYMDKLSNDMKLIEKKSDRILNLYIDESITKDEYNKKKEELSVLKDNIQAQITKLNEANDDFEITVEYLLDVASRSYSLFKSSGIDVKRKILKLVFPNFYLDGQNLSYDIRKPFNIFAKGLNYLENLGRKDSNLRMPGPKPGALPLGDAPLRATFIILYGKYLLSIFLIQFP